MPYKNQSDYFIFSHIFEPVSQSISYMDVSARESALSKARDRIRSFHALKLGWDAYEGQYVSEIAIANALSLLHEIESEPWRYAPLNSAPSAVLPVADGGIQIEWRNVNDELEVEISPSNHFNYLLDRPNKAPQYAEGSVTQNEVLQIIQDFLKVVPDAD